MGTHLTVLYAADPWAGEVTPWRVDVHANHIHDGRPVPAGNDEGAMNAALHAHFSGPGSGVADDLFPVVWLELPYAEAESLVMVLDQVLSHRAYAMWAKGGGKPVTRFTVEDLGGRVLAVGPMFACVTERTGEALDPGEPAYTNVSLKVDHRDVAALREALVTVKARA